VTIASGEMYPERGMPDNEKYRRRGADPPRNESGTGMTDSVSTCDESHRSVSSGNDTCIGAKTSSNYQSARPRRMTSHTRLLCPYCPQRREAKLARYPVCPLRVFWVYNKVADSGNVVTEKQGSTVVGLYLPSPATILCRQQAFRMAIYSESISWEG